MRNVAKNIHKKLSNPLAIKFLLASSIALPCSFYLAIENGIINTPFSYVSTHTGVEETDDIKMTGVAKEGIHFLALDTKEIKNDITLYYSYTSKSSWEAFKALQSIESKYPEIKFNYVHLNLSDSWSVAHKTKITLRKMNITKLSDNELFSFFTEKKNKSPLRDITGLLIKHNINVENFFEVYNSVDVLKDSASHFEQYINKGINFIPDLYINGNNQIILGSLSSYRDIDLVIKSVLSKNAKPRLDTNKE